MNSKNNRVNHDFQIAYFLAGACHTPDGAYSLLCDLKENREMALAGVKAASLRTQANIVKAQHALAWGEKWEQLEAEADLAEIEANKKVSEKNITAAEAELDFINKCIERLQPHRKFKHLSDPEAHEAVQREEWRLELISRAENYLLTTGTIPTDHFTTMRQHPDFENDILPVIESTRKAIHELSSTKEVIDHINKNKVNIPLLISS